MPIFITAAPLLVQLRLAVTNSTAAATFTASTTAGIPIAAAALDLMQEISNTVNDHWWATYKGHHGHGRGKVATELRWWAIVARKDPALARTCQLLCEGWCVEINGLLQPVRRWELKGACPECKAARVRDINEDGDHVSGPALALVFTADGKNWGECKGCGTKFDTNDLADHLARSLGSA